MTITGNEKAVIGGLASSIMAVVIQLQQSGNGFTFHEFLVALVAYAVTHLTVWLTTNTPKQPSA